MDLQAISTIPAEASLNWEALSNRCLGRIDLIERALVRFNDSLSSDLINLEQAAGASDSEAILRIAHRIKGASLTVSAGRLSTCAIDLENKAGSSAEELDACIEGIREECSRLSDLIAHCLEEDG